VGLQGSLMLILLSSNMYYVDRLWYTKQISTCYLVFIIDFLYLYIYIYIYIFFLGCFPSLLKAKDILGTFSFFQFFFINNYIISDSFFFL
jgi:hypothetical protein